MSRYINLIISYKYQEESFYTVKTYKKPNPQKAMFRCSFIGPKMVNNAFGLQNIVLIALFSGMIFRLDLTCAENGTPFFS